LLPFEPFRFENVQLLGKDLPENPCREMCSSHGVQFRIAIHMKKGFSIFPNLIKRLLF